MHNKQVISPIQLSEVDSVNELCKMRDYVLFSDLSKRDNNNNNTNNNINNINNNINKNIYLKFSIQTTSIDYKTTLCDKL